MENIYRYYNRKVDRTMSHDRETILELFFIDIRQWQ